MAVKNSVAPLPLSTIDSATFTGAFQLLSPAAGIAQAVQMLYISNNSNVVITVSYDGVNNHDYIIAGQTRMLNFQTNSQPNTSIAKLAKGTKVYVLGAAGVGLVALSGWYQVNN